jgi:hypothetical protein
MILLLALAVVQTDAAQTGGPALYVWSEAKAIAGGGSHDELLKFCAGQRISRLYFMASGRDDLRPFLKAAHAAKLQVMAMHPGDMDEWLQDFPDKFHPEGIADWCAKVLEQPFDGVQLDIEPANSPHWKKESAKLAGGFLELLAACRTRIGKKPLGAAIPHWWDREELTVEYAGRKRLLVDHVLDLVDTASIMAYRGPKLEKVLEAIAHECGVKAGAVEVVLETDTSVVEEGVPLHVGTKKALDEIFAGVRKKHPSLKTAVHHYTTWRVLAE